MGEKLSSAWGHQTPRVRMEKLPTPPRGQEEHSRCAPALPGTSPGMQPGQSVATARMVAKLHWQQGRYQGREGGVECPEDLTLPSQPSCALPSLCCHPKEPPFKCPQTATVQQRNQGPCAGCCWQQNGLPHGCSGAMFDSWQEEEEDEDPQGQTSPWDKLLQLSHW